MSLKNTKIALILIRFKSLELSSFFPVKEDRRALTEKERIQVVPVLPQLSRRTWQGQENWAP